MSQEEQQQSGLKELIAKGKEQGYLTYAEVNDHLPDTIVDPEQIEDIVAMINDMGITVYEHAPDADSLLLNDEAVQADDEAAEEAAAALANVDGDFGRNSSKAMAEFQSENGLTPTGNVTLNDYLKLKEVYHVTIENFPFEMVTQRGSRGEYVYRIQILLNKRGFPCGEPDGAYGPGTATAVAMLQTRSGMQATGVMDEPTLVALKGFKA